PPRRARRSDALMLTVDFYRLDLRDRQTLLDLGCGGGRPAFEAMRRGAPVLALHAPHAPLQDASPGAGGTRGAGARPPPPPSCPTVPRAAWTTVTRSRCRSRTNHSIV